MRQSIGSWRRAGVVALAILFTIGAAPVLAAGLSFPSATHEDIWRLLTAEIARDKELTSHGINRARMTQVQERLAPGIEGKERVLEDISGATLPLFVKMHALLEKTLADEKRIIDGGDPSLPTVRRTGVTGEPGQERGGFSRTGKGDPLGVAAMGAHAFGETRRRRLKEG